MDKSLYIDASHPDETRIVLKSNLSIEEYEYEDKNRLNFKNNIYLGTISRVEPSLQAAFVDFGRLKHGFLAFNDIQSDYYQIPSEDKERLKSARKKTGLKCSMVVATGLINNIKITAIASDFDFLGASVEAAEGEAILFASQYSIENKQPLLICTSGGGMRMQASMISLSQMPRSILAINELKKHNLPYIVLLTDPTAGGITASYAMVGDLHIAEPGALVAFAGARVIQGTVKEELPEGFQKSEYLEKTGFVDLIVDRKDLSKKIGTLLSILLKKNSAISTEENETTKNTQSLSKVAS